MNIKITHAWLLEYLDTKATPQQIQKYLSLCGPSVERVEDLGNGDVSYDIEITSNRVDMASVEGIAREAATILSRFEIPSTLKKPPLATEKQTDNTLPLTVLDETGLCRRILAVVMDNVSIAPSPEHIRQRLEIAGIRSLNNAVDITNYIMTEIGHPTHVFDYDRIQTHSLIIRYAKAGEEIVTLDNKKYHLAPDDIIIDDGTGKVIDLPGIMGTANSVVTPTTKRIIYFIESNDPVAIRRSSMRYGIRTMAATINEKNPDPETAKRALMRGIELFESVMRAKQASNIIDIYPSPIKPVEITTDTAFINGKIGIEINEDQIVSILEDLEFSVKRESGALQISVPVFRRADVSIPEDIVEEVARIYGYHNLPDNLSPAVYVKQPKEMEELFVYQSKIKSFLKHVGMHEVLNYSMISLDMIKNFGLDPQRHLYLSNVLSEEIKYLRITLIPSLLKNIKANEGKRTQLRLFELAKIYPPQEGNLPDEQYKLALITNTSFADLKGAVEALLNELHIESYKFQPSKTGPFTHNLQAQLLIEGKEAGIVGQVTPTNQQNFGIKSTCFAAELDFSTLIASAKTIANYKRPHPYAVIKLDQTVQVNQNTTYEALKEKAFKSSSLLQDIEVVSVFENKLTLRYYFASSHRNITEEEAKAQLKSLS
jgi:phenylalanyl-tRNA synthetase beta chain